MSLNERIAKCLQWSLEDVQSMSLQSLREIVRPIDSALAKMISNAIMSGKYQ